MTGKILQHKKGKHSNDFMFNGKNKTWKICLIIVKTWELRNNSSETERT